MDLFVGDQLERGDELGTTGEGRLKNCVYEREREMVERHTV